MDQKNPVGRPPIKITTEMMEKAEAYAAQGLTLEQVAKMLGICYDTLNEKRKKYPEFSEAIKRGQVKGIESVTNALYNKASAGDTTSMIFYLKNRDPENWKDRTEQNTRIYGDAENPVAVTQVEFKVVDP